MNDLHARVSLIIQQRALFSNVPAIYLIIKRIFDFASSFIALIFLFPLFVLVAIAIKLDSKGPVFFIQERSGFMGRSFKMYKFRSMQLNAEENLTTLEQKNEVSGPMFKIKKDPRVTKVGRFIRKTSIDELPQLFNVLIGEMSIVGPRPPIPREVVKYDAWHNLRLSVKPGITGLWQVSGRSSVGFEDMVRMDLKYLRERSLLYDMKIILKTIPVLIGDTTAF